MNRRIESLIACAHCERGIRPSDALPHPGRSYMVRLCGDCHDAAERAYHAQQMASLVRAACRDIHDGGTARNQRLVAKVLGQAEIHHLELALGYLRYEALRKLNASQYQRLSRLHLDLCAEPRVTFDELVDLLVIGELQL